MIKKIFQNTFVRLITALGIVAIFSGVTLVFVYRSTIDKIDANMNAAREQAIRKIFSGTSKIKATKMKEVWEVFDENGKSIGYAFSAEGNGYQGAIVMIAGANSDLSEMHGMEVLESQETPGLGAEIASDNFKQQFADLSITHPIEYVKNKKPEEKYQIEAITGATISSRAVVNILNKRIKAIRENLGISK